MLLLSSAHLNRHLQISKILNSYNVQNVDELVQKYVKDAMAATGSSVLQRRLDAAELLCSGEIPALNGKKMAVGALQTCMDTVGEIGRETASNVKAAVRAVELLSRLSSGDAATLKKSAAPLAPALPA